MKNPAKEILSRAAKRSLSVTSSTSGDSHVIGTSFPNTDLIVFRDRKGAWKFDSRRAVLDMNKLDAYGCPQVCYIRTQISEQEAVRLVTETPVTRGITD